MVRLDETSLIYTKDKFSSDWNACFSPLGSGGCLMTSLDSCTCFSMLTASLLINVISFLAQVTDHTRGRTSWTDHHLFSGHMNSDCTSHQSNASHLKSSLSALQKCSKPSKNLSFASWLMLNFVSRRRCRDIVEDFFSSWFWCAPSIQQSPVACGTWLLQFGWLFQLLQCSGGQKLPPSILPTGGFVEE